MKFFFLLTDIVQRWRYFGSTFFRIRVRTLPFVDVVLYRIVWISYEQAIETFDVKYSVQLLIIELETLFSILTPCYVIYCFSIVLIQELAENALWLLIKKEFISWTFKLR